MKQQYMERVKNYKNLAKMLEAGDVWIALYESDPEDGGKETTYESYTRLKANLDDDFEIKDCFLQNNKAFEFPRSTNEPNEDDNYTPINFVCLLIDEFDCQVVAVAKLNQPFTPRPQWAIRLEPDALIYEL